MIEKVSRCDKYDAACTSSPSLHPGQERHEWLFCLIVSSCTCGEVVELLIFGLPCFWNAITIPGVRFGSRGAFFPAAGAGSGSFLNFVRLQQ